MPAEQALTAGGHTVGELLRMSCEPQNARMKRVTPYRVVLEWPWRRVDKQVHSRRSGISITTALYMGPVVAGGAAARPGAGS